MLRLGVNTPVVLQTPADRAEWEVTAGIEEIARVAEVADRLGFDHVTCSEHVAVPQDASSPMLGSGRGTMYWDPLATFGYLAARTSGIRFATSVLVLGYHHPLAIAKRYGTLDQVSGGRLVLGVGVGTLTEEFELLDAPFQDRGARADDAMKALRHALSQRLPSYDGTYYRFSEMVVEPPAKQERVPMWVGGASLRALRRATALAEGWIPSGMSPELLRQRLARYPAPRPDFEVVVRNIDPIDPAGSPEAANQALAELAEAGATMVEPRFVHRSLEHYLEQLEALAALPVYTPARPRE